MSLWTISGSRVKCSTTFLASLCKTPLFLESSIPSTPYPHRWILRKIHKRTKQAHGVTARYARESTGNHSIVIASTMEIFAPVSRGFCRVTSLRQGWVEGEAGLPGYRRTPLIGGRRLSRWYGLFDHNCTCIPMEILEVIVQIPKKPNKCILDETH